MEIQRIQGMDDDRLQPILQYLQNRDVQKRIQNNIDEGRENAAVSISRAAALFGFNEQQLRDWDRRGLIQAERMLTQSDEGKSTRGHRQYSLEELDKLALIKELLKEGNFSVSEIPSNILTIWSTISKQEKPPHLTSQEGPHLSDTPVDVRIESARSRLFWRQFVSNVLRLSLLLIHEENLGTYIGIVLPLAKKVNSLTIQAVEDLHTVGESLVGWLAQSLSSHTLLTASPSFRYGSEFSVVPLRSMKLGAVGEDRPEDNTLIIVKRNKGTSFTLNRETVETIRTLLRPIYEEIELSRACFGLEMNDVLDPAPDLADIALYPDLLLTGMANMVVRLSSETGRSKLFCCILSPLGQAKPLQQRSLLVLAQSTHSPYKVGVTNVVPDEANLNSLSLRAFQSGRVAYRPVVLPQDEVVVNKEDEEHSVCSAIAIPIGGEEGDPIGVIYVTSEQQDAFSELDRKVLRLIGRIIEQTLRTFYARRREAYRLGDLIQHADDVDELFKEFLPENRFLRDVEETLADVNTQRLAHGTVQSPQQKLSEDSEPFEEVQEPDVLSIIAIDVDDIGIYSTKYGDLMVRNLCREVGQRIHGELSSLFEKYKSRLYHIYADRFYVLLWDMPFERVKEKAQLLKESLDHRYKVSILPTEATKLPSPGTMIDADITVRFAISSYSRQTLEELLKRYTNEHSEEAAVPTLRQSIERALTAQLKKGMDRGGNVIISWIPEKHGYDKLTD